MLDKWKTIDNYYQKKKLYKVNKAQNAIPSQGNAAKKMLIDNGVENVAFDASFAPKINNSSTKARKPEALKIESCKLREHQMQEFYHGNNKSVESSRNHAQKIK